MKDIGSNNYVSTTTVARFMAKFDNEFNREDIEKRDFKLFAFHLNYFKDKVSDRMKTSINDLNP